MAVKLDAIENSKVEETSDGLRIIRGGTVTELPNNGNGQFDPTVLIAALDAPGVPQVGDQHAVRPSARVVRRIALPAQSADTVKMEIHYETMGLIGALPDNSFRIIRDQTVMTNEMTELDWNGRPIKAWYKPVLGPGVVGPVLPLDRNVKMNRMVPLNAMVASGLITGRPSINMLIAQGRVNSAPWQGLGIGFWFCSGLDVVAPAIGNKYAVTATFITKLHLDWAGYGVIEHDALGAPPDIKAAHVQALRNREYDFNGPFPAAEDANYNGLVKAPLYGPADLAAIFSIP
jgi:hypothetical protein